MDNLIFQISGNYFIQNVCWKINGLIKIKRQSFDIQIATRQIDTRQIDTTQIDTRQIDTRQIDTRQIDTRQIDTRQIDRYIDT